VLPHQELVPPGFLPLPLHAVTDARGLDDISPTEAPHVHGVHQQSVDPLIAAVHGNPDTCTDSSAPPQGGSNHPTRS
jgi:hypothetical protein